MNTIPTFRQKGRHSNALSHAPDRRVLCGLSRLMFAVLGCGAVDANANEIYVIVGGGSLSFSPQTVDIQAGDTVTFLNFGGVHNVVADDGSFRCAQGCDNDGLGGSGGASALLWTVSINFPTAGTVGYFCELHGAPGEGMFGTINVAAEPPPPTAADPMPVPVGGIWPLILLGVGLPQCAWSWLTRSRRRKSA